MLILADSTRLRYGIGSLMYFAQGIPQGILGIAMPAWLASEGATANQVGSYLAIIVLPWAFKLLSGPIMDRFGIPAMGRRRPWVLAAQAGLAISLLSLSLITNPIEQLSLLCAIGFLINSFAATQDVAVDGMAIDITPVREQGRLNAFMSFGKTIGWSVTGAIAGVLLTRYGLTATGVAAALASLIPLALMLLVLERDGERRWPWSAGQAMSEASAADSFGTVFRGIKDVLWRPTSLIVLIIMFFDGLIYGYGHALMPIAAVKLFGYTTEQWSQLVSTMGLIGACITLALGPVIDRLGAKAMLVLTMALVGLHALVLAQTEQLWTDSTYVRVMLSVYVAMLPIVMVASLSLAMSICSGPVSATQFAIFMSMINAGNAVGSKLYGTFAEQTGWSQSYTLKAALVGIMICVILFFRHQREEDARRTSPHATLMTGGFGASTFWSGAFSCPKCFRNMVPVRFDDIEIDRCESCGGLWFDAGELEILSKRKASAELDVGKAESIGKNWNSHREYRCPRCSGKMEHGADQRQPHIGFETCAECGGSFLDAGEFRDLVELTPREFLRSLFSRREH